VIFRVLKITARILGAIVVLLVLYFGVTFLQIWLRGHEHATKSAQAILVFGTTEDNGTPSPELETRLDQALKLYDAGRAPWVVVTGADPVTSTPKPACRPPISKTAACRRRAC